MPDPTISAIVRTVVTEADTALALGSGDVPVLGTPRAVALVEAATVAAAADLLGAGETTVGTRIELDHRRPSPIGSAVTAEAVLVERSGQRLTFDVRVIQDSTTVASGRVVRAIVHRNRFPG